MLTPALKELEDYTWFPDWLRNYQTDFVGSVSQVLRVYAPFAEYLQSQDENARIMKDLCAGSGIPAITVFEACRHFEYLLLSDKFPRHMQELPANVSYIKHSCDVMNMDFSPGVCYTMFNAFHHFTDEEKILITGKIIAAGSHAYFVEVIEPGARCLLKVLTLTTLGVFLFTPFIRPFSLSRLFFTYVIPLNVLTIAIDGVISVRRSKTIEAYRNLFGDDDATIKVFELKQSLCNNIIIKIQTAP